MKKRKMKMLAIALSGLVLLGCAQSNANTEERPKPDENLAGIVQEGADEQKNIKLEDVKSIELYDLDGNLLERSYTEDFTEKVVKAWNTSMIDDTAYIEMIAGSRMIITLKDDTQISIISYGNEERIVATMGNTTYHLICPEIGKILLDK